MQPNKSYSINELTSRKQMRIYICMKVNTNRRANAKDRLHRSIFIRELMGYKTNNGFWSKVSFLCMIGRFALEWEDETRKPRVSCVSIQTRKPQVETWNKHYKLENFNPRSFKYYHSIPRSRLSPINIESLISFSSNSIFCYLLMWLYTISS